MAGQNIHTFGMSLILRLELYLKFKGFIILKQTSKQRKNNNISLYIVYIVAKQFYIENYTLY